MLSFAGRAGLKDTTYFDMEWQRTTKEKAFYYRLPVEKEGNRYRMRDYYMSGTLQMDGYSTSPDTEINVGYHVYYFENGNKKYEGAYVKGMKDGKWIYYYKDTAAIWYLTNYYQGMIVDRLEQYYPNGKIKSWEWHINDSSPITIGACFDENGKEIAFSPFYEIPSFAGDLHATINSNVIYPEILRKNGVIGTVWVRMLIDTIGKVKRIEIDPRQPGKHPAMRKEALRVASLLKEWAPGREKGVLVESTMIISVPFPYIPAKKKSINGANKASRR
ncbi:MAG TPA: energy transducer TonB [Flavipsychrobacter sp.]